MPTKKKELKKQINGKFNNIEIIGEKKNRCRTFIYYKKTRS
jgi:hypothetical protein